MDARPDFDREAAERILRRAIELSESTSGSIDPGSVSEQALLEAADELGVDAQVVRRAASEERLGLLEGTEQFGDRLVGPGVVMATRLIDEPAGPLMGRVDVWLRRQGALKRRRVEGDGLAAEYERRSDAVAGVQRALRSITGQEDLGRVRRVRVITHPVDDGRSILAFGADLQMERTAALAGGSSVAGIGSTVSVIGAFDWSAFFWLGVPASIAAGVGVMRLRAMSVPDVEVGLQGVLERIASKEAPTGVIDDVRDRLLGGLSSQRRRS